MLVTILEEYTLIMQQALTSLLQLSVVINCMDGGAGWSVCQYHW